MITIDHLRKLTPEGVSLSLAVTTDPKSGLMTITLTPRGKSLYQPLMWTGTPEELAKEIPHDLDEVAVGVFGVISNTERYAEDIKKATAAKDDGKKADEKKPEPKKPAPPAKKSGSKKPVIPPTTEAPEPDDDEDEQDEDNDDLDTDVAEAPEPPTTEAPEPAPVTTEAPEPAAVEPEPAAAEVKIDLPVAADDDEPPMLF